MREEELSEICRTSRTPVRQAIRRLSDEGLVTIGTNKRSYVADVDEAHAEEIFDFLAFIESYLAGLAAQRITAEQLRELNELLDRQRQLIARDANDDQGYLDLNAVFHRTIHEASGSPTLVEIVGRVENFAQSLYLKLGRPTENVHAFGQHEQLYEAIASGNRTMSELAMRVHIESVRMEFREIWINFRSEE